MELAVAQPAGGCTIGRGNWKWTAARVSAVPAFKKGRSPRLWSVSHTQYSLLRCWSVLMLQLEKGTWRLDVFSSFALPRARIIDKELACFKQEERLSCPIHSMVPQNLDKPANSAVSLLRILWESSATSLHILCESSMGPVSPWWTIGEVSVNHLQILCDFSVGVGGVICEVSAQCFDSLPLSPEPPHRLWGGHVDIDQP